MAAKFFVAICTFALINVATSQVIRGYPPLVDYLPNQVYYPSVYPNLIGNCDLPIAYEPIITTPVAVPATTTIIQDSTVANNLANALQLLVVSNLLSNTLPYMGADVVVPGYGCGTCGAPVVVPGYSYIY